MSRISFEKMNIVDSTVKLLDEYELIGAADLNKVGSSMLQDLRKLLKGRVIIKGIKNTFINIAMEKAGLENTKEFLELIKGQNIYLFSNGNPFKLAMSLHKNKARVFAKEGDTALENIIIPSGNTGLSPGPIISKFGALGVRTRIESGNIWVVQDTQVAKVGEVISADLADLLSRMNIRASEMGLEIKAVYEKGVIIPKEDLILDIYSFQKNLESAYSDAYQVALKVAYPTTSTISTLLSLAMQNAKKVALNAEYITKDIIFDLIAKVNSQAVNLAKMVGRAQAGV